MNLFDYLKNENFFKPLNSKYKKEYYDCMQLLIDKTKELPVLYESDARDCITFYLRNTAHISPEALKDNLSDDLAEDQADETNMLKALGEDSETNLQPSSIMSFFRDVGWILPREIGRNGEYVVNVSSDCRRIMDFLRKLTERSGQGAMSNRIFSMYEIMKSAFEKDSPRMEHPYNNILVPMIDNESELKNELTDLKDSISDIMKAVIVFQDMNLFGQFIMRDQMLDKFFNEYFFIKNNGLIPTQLAFIRSKVRKFKEPELYRKITTECAERLQMDMQEAEERVNLYLAELAHFLAVEYEENMELIDMRINNYYNLANTRIMLIASSGERMESKIHEFLTCIGTLSEDEKNEAIKKAGEALCITQQRYVGYKSFEKKRRLKNLGENTGLYIEPMTEEEKEKRTEQLFRQAENRYSVEKTKNYLNAQIGNSNSISIGEKPITSKDEILMYAAAMAYVGNEEFPFDIELEGNMVETEMAEITGARIVRRNAQKGTR